MVAGVRGDHGRGVGSHFSSFEFWVSCFVFRGLVFQVSGFGLVPAAAHGTFWVECFRFWYFVPRVSVFRLSVSIKATRAVPARQARNRRITVEFQVSITLGLHHRCFSKFRFRGVWVRARASGGARNVECSVLRNLVFRHRGVWSRVAGFGMWCFGLRVIWIRVSCVGNFKAYRRLFHSTLGSRVTKKKVRGVGFRVLKCRASGARLFARSNASG